MNQGMVICYPLICIIPTLYRSYSPECQAKTLPLHIVIDMNMGIDNLNIVEVLIAEKESGRVEFKETTGQLERGMETLCAFLNGEGGTVLFGVNDKGKIIGQEVSDKTKRDIADAINRLEPVAAVQISYAPIPNSEKKVIAFRVENSKNNRPFSYKGRPYMRVESATTTMPQATYNDLLLQRDGNQYRWELLENRDLTLQDLDVNEVLKTVRLGIECGRLPEDTGTDVPVILEKFGLQCGSRAVWKTRAYGISPMPASVSALQRHGQDCFHGQPAHSWQFFPIAQRSDGIYIQAPFLIRYNRHFGTGGTFDHSV